jgi:hypothetical protein
VNHEKNITNTSNCDVAFFLATIPSHANPYCTFGGGNCTYFTWECINTYWDVTPNIPRSWNAYEWINLIDQQKDGYIIKQVETPTIGDIFVLPQTLEYPLGHVGMIIGVTWDICLVDGTYEVCYKVIESGMYANEFAAMFPYKFKGCKYRYHNYWQEDLVDAVFLRCTENQ